MSNIKKALMSGAAGGGGLNVEDVFSIYLYDGTGSDRTITNGIDLSGEGGLIWFKQRTATADPTFFDTELGGDRFRNPNLTYSDTVMGADAVVFNSDGFSFANTNQSNPRWNASSQGYVSWTFRKATKFFDVVTWTGDGTGAGRSIPHNLGVAPGFITLKNTSSTTNFWPVYHRGLGDYQGAEHYRLALNTTDRKYSDNWWNRTAPTDSYFQISADWNDSGKNYVAYLFAHNDGDGEFGPTGDQDIIKCGSYTGNGDSNGPQVDLGFEPQWIMIKEATTVSGNGGWWLADNMRGADEVGYEYMQANGAGVNYLTQPYITINSTGFKINQNDNTLNENNQTYVYIAIRRGPMAVPESATDVFDTVLYNGVTSTINLATSFPYDASMIAIRNAGSAKFVMTTRNSGPKWLATGLSGEEYNTPGLFQTNPYGYWNTLLLGNGRANGFDWVNWDPVKTYVNYGFKRAPGFFDIITYLGNGVSGRTVPHYLGVAPEMMWIKRRTGTDNWRVYHKDIGNTSALYLNSGSAVDGPYSVFFNNTSPTDTEFTLGTDSGTNFNGNSYKAYLFASLDGVSKVGSYVGTGTTQTIDIGFAPRFFMTKGASQTGPWYVVDTARGIVAGNDPLLALNDNAAEITSVDAVDPISNGVQIVNSSLNDNGATYIYYAIA